ncbi:archease [Candidatus Aenigmatarchaeota archaeon]
MTIKYLEDIAIADIAFEVISDTVNSLFEECAHAVLEQHADLSKIEEKTKKTINVEEDDIKQLLYDFLSEIIYLIDTESMIFKRAEVSISEDNKKLTASLFGEKIDRDRHELKAEIKAITMHMFNVEKRQDKWYAHVIVDV